MTPWRHGKGQRGRREGGREGKRTHGSGTWPGGPPTGALSPASKKPSYISDWLHCASWRDGEHVLVSSLSLSLSLSFSLSLSHPVLTPHPHLPPVSVATSTNTAPPTRPAGVPRSFPCLIHELFTCKMYGEK